MRDVIGHLIKILERGGEAIVCQVVETRGSTPQKAGAIMVVGPTEDGRNAGRGLCRERGEDQGAQAALERNRGRSLIRPGPRLCLGRRHAICGGRMVVIAQPARGEEGGSRLFPGGRQVSRGGARIHRGGSHRHAGGRRAAAGPPFFV